MPKALQIATYIVTWVSFPLAVVSCILRCYCCRNLKRSWNADDFMSLAVGTSLLGALGLWQRGIFLGCAGPEPNACNSEPNGNAFTEWLFISSIYYAFLQFIVRTAFFISYLQFSAQSNFRLWIGIGFGMNVMLLIVNTLLVVCQCKPIAAAFRPIERLKAQCMDRGFTIFAPAVLNALLNLYVLILPIPIFWSVRMPRRRKMYICFVVIIGGTAVILGFVRINSLRILNTNTNTSDGAGEMMVVAALGMSLAAIAHNLPSLRVFWMHILKSRTKTKDTLRGPFELNSQDRLHTTNQSSRQYS